MELAALLVDTFLFSLTWVVQLVVYPGFRWVDSAGNPNWHSAYSRGMVALTLPSMLLQISLHGYLLFQSPDVPNGVALMLVAGTWVLTFARAVPIHEQISKQGPHVSLVRSLRFVHSFRTTLWTLLFLLQVFLLYVQ
jgi:hypothetical protein